MLYMVQTLYPMTGTHSRGSVVLGLEHLMTVVKKTASSATSSFGRKSTVFAIESLVYVLNGISGVRAAFLLMLSERR